MPELPEVEAARKLVEEHCLGHPIIKATVADDSVVLSDVTPVALEEALIGRIIVRVQRKGKHLWWELDRRPWPTFQFGMTGNILIKDLKAVKYKRASASDNEDWPSKFSKVLVKLDNGMEMAFTDKRRFARVRLLQDPPTELPISQLGPDAYAEYPEEEMFVQALQQRKGALKGVLLDQTFLAGIGNWMADEVLYQARLHPAANISRLTSEDFKTLYKSIKEVVEWSVKVNSDHEQFPKSWIFHHRWNKKPGSLEGHEIKFLTVGGRTSAYVPALQKQPGVSAGMFGERATTTSSVIASEVTTENIISRASLRRRRGKPKNTDAEDVTIIGEEKPVGDMIPREQSAEENSPKTSVRGKKKSTRRKSTGSADPDEPDILGSRPTKKKLYMRALSNTKSDKVTNESTDAEDGEEVEFIVSRRYRRRLPAKCFTDEKTNP